MNFTLCCAFAFIGALLLLIINHDEEDYKTYIFFNWIGVLVIIIDFIILITKLFLI